MFTNEELMKGWQTFSKKDNSTYYLLTAIKMIEVRQLSATLLDRSTGIAQTLPRNETIINIKLKSPFKTNAIKDTDIELASDLLI